MRHFTLFAAALLLGGFSAVAQSNGLRSFEATSAMDRAALKHVIQAVVDIDPGAEVFHSDDMRVLQVRANAQVSESDLRAAIQGTGIQLREGSPDLSAYYPAPSLDTPPIYVVTGVESEDLARYQAAVAVWNQNHPEQQLSATPLHMIDR
ncbi:MAG: hypothetical protein R2818_13195 [Flavobacteriales bacterium]